MRGKEGGEVIVTKPLKKSSNIAEVLMSYLGGVALLSLMAVGTTAIFSNKVSLEFFAAFATVVTLTALFLAYFKLLTLRTLAIFIVTGAILLGGIYWSKLPKVEGTHYQAVFLTNGQVYFGHLHDPDSPAPALTDIYYLQTNSSNPQDNKADQNQSTVGLVKLGNELHGPEDKMALKAQQILFWENLKDSSKVVQTIKSHQAKSSQ